MSSTELSVKWSAIMRDQQASGQTVREYCRERGVSEHRCYYWRKRLREAEDERRGGFVELVGAGACSPLLEFRVSGASLLLYQPLNERYVGRMLEHLRGC